MQLVYGNYAFPVNGADVTSRSSTTFSKTGRPVRYVVGYRVVVVLLGSGQVNLSIQENLLKAALYQPYKDLVLLTDTGVASSAQLLNRNSLSGVRLVSGPNFGESRGGEFATRRTAEFELEAEYLVPNAERAVIEFSESVSIVGTGGPDTVWRFPLNASPIRQIVKPFSIVRAVQSGRMVGHTTRLTPPFPLWPDYEVQRARVLNYENPEARGLAYINWPVSWSYTFEAGRGGILIGFPGLPPQP